MTAPLVPAAAPGTGGPAGRLRRGLHRDVPRLLQAPVTWGFVAVFWVLAIVTGSLVHGPRERVLRDVGASVESFERLRLFTFVTSGGWAPGLLEYLLATVAVVGVGLVVERHWGSVRLLWVALLTQFLGVALGLAAADVLDRWGSDLASEMTADAIVGPWPMLVGVLLAFSATTTPLWRRRIRLGVLAAVAVLTLYNGSLDNMLRVGAAVVGLLLGRVVLTRSRYPRTLRSARRETRATVAVLMAASAIGPVLVALNNRAAGPFIVLRYTLVSPQVGPDELDRLCRLGVTAQRCEEYTRQLRFHGVGPVVLSLLPSLLVLLLAYGLMKGRRFAWWSMVAVQTLLAGLGLVMFLQALAHRRQPALRDAPFILGGNTLAQITPLLVPLILVTVLLLTRWAFDIPAPRGTYRGLARLLAVAVASLFVLFVGAGLLIAGQFTPTPSVADLINEFPHRLAPPGYLGLIGLDFVPTTIAGTLLFEWTGIALWGIAIAGVLRSFNANRVDTTARDAADARRILQMHGRQALSYLTMWQGNTYWFTPARSSFVAYRVQSGVAITMGDAIGPAAETADAMRGFAEFCASRSWTFCFYSTTGGARDIGSSFGWPSVQVAEEAMLPLGSLTFSGKKFQDIRTAVSRAAREGISTRWLSFPEAPLDVSEQIAAISEEWMDTKGLPEMGFTLGGVDEIDDPAVRCLIAVDEAGLIHGITSWLPVYRDGAPIGWTLDYMRRRSEGFKGGMEFLISRAALQFQEEGAEFVSLSGAPLARMEQGRTPTALQRLLDATGHRMEPVYGFRSLLSFKAKFQPVYRPIHMIYPEAAALPRIGNAISRAYLPHLSLVDAVRLLRKLRPATPERARPATAAVDPARPAEQLAPRP
ncbi:DUF2156 domain-containing protein [Nakamurella deserti]|uniref:DUF2156 domain-containing protein n=1 Tax=Nakamurella deserti TaxID=2164074 RepID=UPI000DBE85F4|nr:DUF2156 domain-containing protein [Nakamurella deserti]